MKYLLSSTTAIIAIVLLYGQDKQTVNVIRRLQAAELQYAVINFQPTLNAFNNF